MRRTWLIRPQAIVVIFIVLVVWSRGEVRWISDARSDDQQAMRATTEAIQTPLVPVTVISTPLTPLQGRGEPSPQTPLQGRGEPSSTVVVVPPAATVVPSPTPAPTAAPSPTPEPTATPAATERPAAPPSGNADEAVIITQPDTGRREMALTFDAGEGAGHTQAILDLLDQYGVTATFGVTGEWAEQNPDLLREIIDRGHQVMNHTYDHRSFTGDSPGTAPLTTAERRAEILKTEQAVWDIAGYELAPYFRFPYGDYDLGALVLLKQLGYDYSLWWGCDSKAWMGHTPSEIVQECGVDDAAPGAIVLLHVAEDSDFEALPGLIETLQADGYDLVSVEQLIQP